MLTRPAIAARAAAPGVGTTVPVNWRLRSKAPPEKKAVRRKVPVELIAPPVAEVAATGLSITNWIGRIVLIGLTWAFFQHLFSGLRHFVLDTGAGYALPVNKLWSTIVIVAALFATAAVWLFIFGRALGGAGA